LNNVALEVHDEHVPKCIPVHVLHKMLQEWQREDER